MALNEDAVVAALAAALGDAAADEAEAVVPYLASMLCEDVSLVSDASAFCGVAGELLIGYGLCDDEAALPALCERLRAACVPLLPAGESKGAQTHGPGAMASTVQGGGGLRLLDAPVVIERDDARAKAEALAALDAPKARGMVQSMGEALYANNSEGLHEEAQIKMTNARLKKQARRRRELEAMRTWQQDSEKKEAAQALEVRRVKRRLEGRRARKRKIRNVTGTECEWYEE